MGQQWGMSNLYRGRKREKYSGKAFRQKKLKHRLGRLKFAQIMIPWKSEATTKAKEWREKKPSHKC